MKYVRRFVFVHYEDLLEVRFRQLEKVTDKLYVFVPARTEEVPFWLVRQMQDMGRDLVWVDVGDVSYAEAQLVLAFHAGHLHAQADPGVEFALLTDAREADALVRYMQAAGREAIRVKRRPQREGGGPSGKTGNGAPVERSSTHDAPDGNEADAAVSPVGENEHDDDIEDLDREGAPHHPAAVAPQRASAVPPRTKLAVANGADAGTGAHERLRNGSRAFGRDGLREPLDRRTAVAAPPARLDEDDVAALAEDVTRKLIRSGQRPAALAELRSYILLHGTSAKVGPYVDDVIEAMAERGEVKVEGGEVRYGF